MLLLHSATHALTAASISFVPADAMGPPVAREQQWPER